MCCTRLAGNTGRKNYVKKSLSAHHRTTLSGYVFATKAHIDNLKKNLLSNNISPTCPHNMVNVDPLAAEIISLVWGTLANFNGFRVLAALLHSQTAALNSGRHLYSAGRPSRWALAHIFSWRLGMQWHVAESLAGVRHQWMLSSSRNSNAFCTTPTGHTVPAVGYFGCLWSVYFCRIGLIVSSTVTRKLRVL